MEALVSIEELKERISLTLSPADEREALMALETLSDAARRLGLPTWTTPENTPDAVKRLIIKATNRYLKNYEGFTQSRAGDETLAWTDLGDKAGSPYFTDGEKEDLAECSGRGGGLQTAPVIAWGNNCAPRDWRGWSEVRAGGLRNPMTPEAK